MSGSSRYERPHDLPRISEGAQARQDSVNLDLVVRHEIARLVQRQFPMAVFGNLAVIVVSWLVFLPSDLGWPLMAMFAVVFVFNSFQVWLRQNLPRCEEASLRRWEVIHRLTSFGIAIGISLGSLFAAGGSEPGWQSEFVRIGDHPLRLLLASVLLMLYGIGWIFSLIGVQRLLIITLPILMVPTLLYNLMVDTAIGYVTALVQFIYVIVLSYFSGSHSNLLVRSLRIRATHERLAVQLQREKNVAIEASLAKSRFFAAASHDLRQPLHALTLLFYMLKSEQPLRERKRVLEGMEDNLKSLESLFSELLDISRLDVGDIRPNNQHFQLQPLFDHLTTRFEGMASEKGIWLRAYPTEAVLYGDPVLLERVLSNLISNAINATSDGGVWVGYRAQRGRIEVRDSGKGIPAGEQERIFDEFYQVDNPTRNRRRGLGLGLATVRRLMAITGAHIHVVSAPDKGSLFAVSVRAGDAKKVDPLPSSEMWEDFSVKGLRVLCADDEENILQALDMVFSNWGAEARCVTNAAAARAAVAKGFIPDVIIADYWLGTQGDGLQMIHEINAMLGRPRPAILISGDTRPEAMRACRDSGVLMMHKPVTPARLKAVLRRAMQNEWAA